MVRSGCTIAHAEHISTILWAYGGDLEHTHLVKGLDYALLNKVRTELAKKQKAEEFQNLSSSSLASVAVRWSCFV